MPAGQRGHPSPLLSTGEPTPGELSPVLGCPVQESHGHTGQSPAKGHQGKLGMENLSYEEKLRELGLFRQEKAQGGFHQNI